MNQEFEQTMQQVTGFVQDIIRTGGKSLQHIADVSDLGTYEIVKLRDGVGDMRMSTFCKLCFGLERQPLEAFVGPLDPVDEDEAYVLSAMRRMNAREKSFAVQTLKRYMQNIHETKQTEE